MCHIGVTWQPKRMDWNTHVWTITTSLYLSVGAVDAIEWACALCDHHIQNDWGSRAMNLHQILHEAWTFFCRNYSDDSQGCSYGQLMIGSFITTTHLLMHHILCRVFWWNIDSPSDWAPLQHRFGAQHLLAFPKTKITLEREEISNHWWDSGNYDSTADGNGENYVRSQGIYFEGDWGIIVLCTVFLVSCIFFNKCLFFILHSWIPSGQTSCVCVYRTYLDKDS